MIIKIIRPVLLLGLLLSVSVSVSSQVIRVGGRSPHSCIEIFEYDYVTQKPSFPGGESKLVEFINDTRQYPKEAYDRGIQGLVTCSFVVNVDGSISNIRLVRNVNALLDEEAIRIFTSMPNWSPGKINGQSVPVRVTRSVRFRK